MITETILTLMEAEKGARKQRQRDTEQCNCGLLAHPALTASVDKNKVQYRLNTFLINCSVSILNILV